MRLSLPENYRPPDGVRPGEPFEVVAMVVLGKDGAFSLHTIDGIELEEKEESKEPFTMPWDEPETPDY